MLPLSPILRSVPTDFTRAIAVLLLLGLAAGTTLADPVLRVKGDHFTVDGHPRFLVLVAYFDAMRAPDAALDEDFSYLRSAGVDGIRLFPNWWDWSDMRRFPGDTLMDAQGTLRPARLSRLNSVLAKASEHGFIVDLSFAFETVGGMSELTEDLLGRSQAELPVNQVHADAYERGLTAAARAFRPYRNVFFDIQNEYNGRITHLSDDEVRRFCGAIKTVDPDRIITASLANEISPEDAAKRAKDVGVDVVAWHESRNPWSYDSMDQLVRRAKRVCHSPFYLGEPAAMEQDYRTEQFIAAVTKSKTAGAAAWTFHTQHGFDLRRNSLTSQLSEEERRFLGAFKPPLENTPWGIATSDP